MQARTGRGWIMAVLLAGMSAGPLPAQTLDGGVPGEDSPRFKSAPKRVAAPTAKPVQAQEETAPRLVPAPRPAVPDENPPAGEEAAADAPAAAPIERPASRPGAIAAMAPSETPIDALAARWAETAAPPPMLTQPLGPGTVQVRDLDPDAIAATAARDAETAIVAYRIVNGREIPHSLTGADGDHDLGQALYFDLEVTGCSGCHGSPGGPGAQSVTGQVVSPALGGVGARLSDGEIRLWLVSPDAVKPGTAMPAYYEAGQRLGAHDPLYGGPRLTAEQIEHLVSYLSRQVTVN